jgi:hypothetical protein
MDEIERNRLRNREYQAKFRAKQRARKTNRQIEQLMGDLSTVNGLEYELANRIAVLLQERNWRKYRASE